jgi:hypothetical protein
MTNTTIDFANIAINLSKSSGTASPENTGISGDKPPFDRSLREAMQLALTDGDIAEAGPEQILPAVWQELPLEDAFNVGLEGVSEVRALAATLITRAPDGTSDPIKNGLDVSVTTAIFTGSMNVSENIVETGYSLRQFDNGSAIPKPLSGVATVLKSDPGSDLSNSETIAADLLREQSKSPGNFNDDINFRTRSLTDILPSEAHEVRTIISGAGLSPEASSNKDNASRASLLEPNVGLSSVSNSESKPSNWPNATQATQQPQMTKPSEVVSSTELATHLRVLKSSGGGEAKLQLHPAELGRMTVSVITEGDEARVSFVVDNSQAKYSVEASLPRLRDLMDASGLSLMDADVSERHSKKDEEQPSDRLMEEALSSSAGGESESLEEVTPPNTSQLLDTFA